MRKVLIALALAAGAAADEAPQVDWAESWEAAFAAAQACHAPVMICINSKDGEQANERTARGIYRDPWFVAFSRRFVMLVVSTRVHAAEGPCPRFGRVTCEQHLACWKDLRAKHGDRFCLPGTGGEMISPQHAWFAPDGILLQRQEYELSRDELLRRMRATLDGVAPDDPAPLDEADRARLEELARGAGEAALGPLLASPKPAVHAALAELAGETDDPALRRALLRAFGCLRLACAREAAEGLLGHADAEVRCFAAVCLEGLADPAAVAALARRARRERDPAVRRDLYRALGACGGPAADRKAAKALLKAAAHDDDDVVRRHAALALAAYAGEGAGLVRKRLERLAASESDREVRQAVVFALAHVGDPASTAPVFEGLIEDARAAWSRRFVEAALRRLRDGEPPLHAGWLFREDRENPARRAGR